MKKHDLMKGLSVVFIILLFVGATISVNATQGETISIKDGIVEQFKIASIDFSNSQVLQIGGRTLPSIKFGEYKIAISINPTFRVQSGEVIVDPLIGKEITLKTEDLFAIKFGILYMDYDPETHRDIPIFGRAFNGHTVQFID